MKLHRVQLSPERRAELEQVASAGVGPVRQVIHARILLKADEGPAGPAWPDWEIVKSLDVSHSTVERVRRRFASSGERAALQARRPTPPPPGKLDGAAGAQVVTLARSPAPPGQARWTLRLLARRLVELEVVDSVSYEMVRRTLKKSAQAVAEATVVPAQAAQRGVCGMYGGRAGRLHSGLRCTLAAGLLR